MVSRLDHSFYVIKHIKLDQNYVKKQVAKIYQQGPDAPLALALLVGPGLD